MVKRWKSGAARGNRLGRDKGFVGGSYGAAGPAVRVTLSGDRVELGIPVGDWVVVGSQCPWNTTPGVRQVWRRGELVSDPAKRKYD